MNLSLKTKNYSHKQNIKHEPIFKINVQSKPRILYAKIFYS
jgi:hypothetical protein